MIIGFGHRKRTGKDSSGSYLVKEHGWNRISFADPLKRAAIAIFGFTHQQCYGSDTDKETVDPRWGFSPRYAFQKLGDDLRKMFGDDIWVRSAEAKIRKIADDGPELPVVTFPYTVVPKDVYKTLVLAGSSFSDPVIVTPDGHTFRQMTKNVTITDVRYPNEAEMIRRNGGIVVRIDRPSLGRPTDEHPSETAMDGFEFDEVILNDGKPEDLYAKIETLLVTYTDKKS